eukprot:TRINITY_DN28212_c0_g1_i1.p1 TRINITY_DN28212_c0_g1~~TRINITY_DN28212_c0_g1_i1.p1  ORF type:complete len:1328 (-),score=144.64 TRINITY_DN28212_c0_g1_i1:411-4256(-)
MTPPSPSFLKIPVESGTTPPLGCRVDLDNDQAWEEMPVRACETTKVQTTLDSVASLAETLGKGKVNKHFIHSESFEETLHRLNVAASPEGWLIKLGVEFQESSHDDDVMRAIAYLKEHRESVRSEGAILQGRYSIDINEDDAKVLVRVARDRIQSHRLSSFELLCGIVVLVNGIFLGVRATGMMEGHELSVEVFFLVLFIIEWGIRFLSDGRVLREKVFDTLALVDLFIIITSFVDVTIQVIFRYFPIFASVSVLRTMRLFRVVRFMKIGRLFDYQVVSSSISRGAHPIAWAIVMIIVLCSMFGIILRIILDCAALSEDRMLNDSICGSKWQMVLAQMKFGTFDGCSTVRVIMNDYHVGIWVFILFFVFVSTTSIGVMNLIPGIMLTVTMPEVEQQSTTNVQTRFLLRHQAISNLADKLTQRCWNGKVAKSKTMSPEVHMLELCLWCEEDHELSGLFQAAGIGQSEIERIFASCQKFHGNVHSITVDQFIQGCTLLDCDVHPLDMLSITADLHGVQEQVTRINEELRLAQSALLEASREIKFHLQHLPGYKESPQIFASAHQPRIVAERTQTMDSVSATCASSHRKIEQEAIFDAEKIRTQATFDRFWSVVVLVNMGLLVVHAGFIADHTSSNVRWLHDETLRRIEMIFALAYAFEAFLRCVLYYQLEVLRDLRISGCLPVLFCRMTSHDLWSSLACLPHMSKDVLFLSDLIVLAICLAEAIMTYLMDTRDVHLMVIAEVLRLPRLLLVARLKGLWGDVPFFFNAFSRCGRVLLWSLVCSVIFSFAFLILAREMVGRIPSSSEMQNPWRSIVTSAMTLIQVATLSQWEGIVMQAYGYHPAMLPFLLIFVMIVSMGFLNILTGVMIKAAYFAGVEKQSIKQQRHVRLACAVFENASENLLTQIRRNEVLELARCKDFVMSLAPREEPFTESPHDNNLGSDSEMDLLDVLNVTSVLSSSGSSRRMLKANSYGKVHHADGMIGEIFQAMWASSTEVVVEFRVLNVICDLYCTRISWEGGSRSPSLVFEIQRETQDGCEYENNIMIAGRLLFSNLPARGSFKFSFVTSGDMITLWPVEVEGTKRPEEGVVLSTMRSRADMNDLNLEEFKMLLRDPKVAHSFLRADMRVDQALVLFQKININESGRVSISDFLAVFEEWRGPSRYLDVSNARSLLRQVAHENVALQCNARNARSCLTGVVEALRGISLGASNSSSCDGKDQVRAPLDHDRRAVLPISAKTRLQKKVHNMRAYLQKQRVIENEQLTDLHSQDGLSIGTLDSRHEAWD